jgi:hypothetical protein
MCFAGIIGLAGLGVVIAEGFFIFLGMSVFLPIASILCVIASGMFGLLILAWISMKALAAVYEYFSQNSEVGFDDEMTGMVEED